MYGGPKGTYELQTTGQKYSIVHLSSSQVTCNISTRQFDNFQDVALKVTCHSLNIVFWAKIYNFVVMSCDIYTSNLKLVFRFRTTVHMSSYVIDEQCMNMIYPVIMTCGKWKYKSFFFSSDFSLIMKCHEGKFLTRR